ncbi:MAG: glycosyl hydrolase, partial [Ruminiclostridium sp.]
DVDYSKDVTISWSEAKVTYTFAEAKQLEGYNKFSFDFIYDPAKKTMGSFSAKLFSGTIDRNTAIDTSKAEDYGNGLKKATVVIELISSANSVSNFTIGLIGSNTDYKGSIYIDNVTFSQVLASDPYVEATKKAEVQTPIKVNSDSIVANGITQATSSKVKLVDDQAISATSQLYAYLEAVGKTDSVLYGHQNDIHHKAGNATLTNSDTKDVTGSISAIMGIDALSLTGNELSTAAWNDTLANRVAACEAVTKEAADQGAIITLSAHMPNFEVIDQRVKNSTPGDTDSTSVGTLSDGHYNFSGYTPGTLTGNIVSRIMPDQDLNYLYIDYLDMLAAYAKALEDDNISVLFRPFHENTGSWFWWGAAFCDEEAYKNLYKYTVEYLRDEKDVHNFIYVYGPSSEAASTAEYAKRYPGDDYVDMVGFDMYHQAPTVGDNFIDQFITELSIVEQFATEHNKLFAVTETGVANSVGGPALLKTDNARKDWYNEVLDAVAPTKAAYFLLWANFGTDSGFYTPYVVSKTATTMRGHEMLDNFIDFYNDPRTVFANEMGDFTQSSVTTTQNTSVTGYITAPISGSRVLKGVTLMASVSKVNDTNIVKFIAKDKTGKVLQEIPATQNESGKYIGQLTDQMLVSIGEAIGTISLVIDGKVYNTINAKFNMPEPVVDPTVVDTFETYYGENAILNTNWSTGKGAGCTIVPSLSNKSYDGDYGLEFKYSLVAGGYVGITKSLNGADWSSKNALQLWTIPDAKNQKVVVQVTSGSNVFEVYPNDYAEYKNSTDAVLVTIPFSSFIGRDNKAAVFDASNIQSLGLWCNTVVPADEDAATYKLDSAIYYDGIKAITSNVTAVTFTRDKAAVPTITVNLPTTKTVTVGNTVNFAITATTTDGGILAYQWYKDGAAISGTMGASINITSAALADSGTYKVVVTNVKGTATAQAESASCTLTVSAAQSGGSDTGGSGGTTTNSTPTANTNTTVGVLINGKTDNSVIATTAKDGEKIVTTITFDEEKFNQKLQSEGQKAVFTIQVNTKADVVVGELSGQMIKNMQVKNAVLEVKTENASYKLPAAQINFDEILKEMGKDAQLKDIKVQIEISKPNDATIKLISASAQKGGFSIVVPSVEFNVKCTFGDKTVEIKKFNTYVERTIAIPEGVDPSKVTTAIVVDADGIARQVPTKIVVIDGKNFAIINSLSNSTYSLVYHPISFKDAENHWAKEAINDMGSRMVISGGGNNVFEPNRDITRSEFAAIVVKSLGLKPGTGNNPFEDVASTDRYCNYIETAYEYGIISGYDKSKFGPMDKVTREQAMTMITKAMKITGISVDIKADEVEKLLSEYTDSKQSSTWAKESIVACVKAGIVSGKSGKILAPKDDITRAEVASIVEKLMKKSGLIK